MSQTGDQAEKAMPSRKAGVFAPFFTVGLAFVLARRGLRNGARGLWAAFACLVLGVAAIGGIASLRTSLAQGLATQGRALLGGDLEVGTGGAPPPAALRAWFAERGARVSEVATLHAMLFALSGRRILVSLKAVDRAWPLVGHAQFAPSMPARRALANHGLAAAPQVADRLGIHQGAMVRLGTRDFTLRAVLVHEPDQGTGAAALLGPPTLIGLRALATTGLVVPGSLVRYGLRAVLAPGASVAETEAALARTFPNRDWRIRTASDAAPGVGRFLDRTALFMTLVALTALLVGGVGVVNGVGAWAEARLPEVATFRALGATPRLVAATLLLQALALSLAGIALGVVIGAVLPWLIAFLFGADLPVPPQLGLYPVPLGIAAGFGLAAALLCMLWPILRAARTAPANLFRGAVLPARVPLSPAPVALSAALIAALLALAVLATGSPRFVFLYAGTAVVCLFVLGAAGTVLARLAARLAGHARRAPLRLGLADLARPGAATPVMVVSIGLGLATLATVALIEGNLRAALTAEIPKAAPTFYFIDIQNGELPTFRRLMHRLPGVEAFANVPMLRARVLAVNGIPASNVPTTHGTRWALDQDLGLTYAAHPPPHNRVTAGHWWPADYHGPPLLSLGAKLAQGWGVKVGDHLTLNVLGRKITVEVTSLRDIAWQRLGLNFFLVASPGLLGAAPHTNIATVRTAPKARATVLTAVTNALPNVSAIEVASVIATVGRIFTRIATAGSALAGLTLAAGILVLGVTVAAEERRRIRQAVILKVLGATRAQIRAAWLVTFAALGLVSGVVAALVAIGTSFGVVRYLMHAPWVFLPLPLAITLIAAVLLMLVAGFWGTSRVLRTKPARWLGRDE